MQNKIYKMLLAFIVLLCVGFGSYSVLTEELPVLVNPVAQGSIITADNITTKRVSKIGSSADYIRNGTEMVGKVAKVDIAAGTPFVSSILEEKSYEVTEDVDMAIIPVPVDSDHVPADLKTGDLINIIVYFSDSSITGESFSVGYNYIGTVASTSTGGGTEISRVDVKMKKELATEIAHSVSLGEIFIIKNYEQNDVSLEGMDLTKIYNNNFHIEINEDKVEVVEDPIVVEE